MRYRDMRLFNVFNLFRNAETVCFILLYCTTTKQLTNINTFSLCTVLGTTNIKLRSSWTPNQHRRRLNRLTDTVHSTQFMYTMYMLINLTL